MKITRADLESARPFQVFACADPRQIEKPNEATQWALFMVDSLGDSIEDDEPGAVARGPSFLLRSSKPVASNMSSPQRDDEACSGADVDDIDACLAYLRSRGVLMFVPDSLANPKFGRFLAVRWVAGFTSAPTSSAAPKRRA